jgi:hypothetical protein
MVNNMCECNCKVCNIATHLFGIPQHDHHKCDVKGD